MAYSWERWYDGACVHNTMKGQGAGKYVRYMTLYCGSTISVSFWHILYYNYFFYWGKGSFLIQSTLWNRRPLKWNSTFSSSISMSNQMVTSEIRKWFHVHFVKFLMISWAFRQDKLFEFYQNEKIFFKMMSILFDYFFIS